MTRISVNQHRWKKSLDGKSIEILESTIERLRWSWGVDAKYPKSYPINTDNVFSELKAELRPRKTRFLSVNIPAPRGPAKSVHDLIDERTVKALYEHQHAGSYRKALQEASRGNSSGFAAWGKLSNCITRSYFIGFGGIDFIPRPKVNFLHRELLAIAAILEIDYLLPDGLAEFFDDLCPCRKNHSAEAIRKLTKRIDKSR